MSRARAAIILAAGQGTRMKSELPKVLHEVGGRPMLDWAIAAAEGVGASRIVVVTGRHAPSVGEHAVGRLGAGAAVVQYPPLGTGHAVRAAEGALADFEGDAIILYGDAPFVPAARIEAMFAARAASGGLAVLGFEAADPTGYGRLIEGQDGVLARIVEHKDASAAERAVKLCNSGVMCADAKTLFALLAQVNNNNSKGEYYLTDIVALAAAGGLSTHIVRGAESDALGVNSRAELAQAEAVFQRRARLAAMEAGVTLLDPGSVYFSYDTVIEPDVVIEPHVVFGKGVKIAKGARINAFCHFTEAEIGPGAQVGPHARLRPGAKLGPRVKIGNFVEVKNSTFGEKAQASHLAYVGDSDVGAGANIGAGAITCNYDGFSKSRTVIGAGAFIGSDTAMVAPVSIGAGAYTGAGSVITKDVPDGALAVSRARQQNFEGWANQFREAKRKDKEAK